MQGCPGPWPGDFYQPLGYPGVKESLAHCRLGLHSVLEGRLKCSEHLRKREQLGQEGVARGIPHSVQLTLKTKHSPVPKKPSLPPNLVLSFQSVDR